MPSHTGAMCLPEKRHQSLQRSLYDLLVWSCEEACDVLQHSNKILKEQSGHTQGTSITGKPSMSVLRWGVGHPTNTLCVILWSFRGLHLVRLIEMLV